METILEPGTPCAPAGPSAGVKEPGPPYCLLALLALDLGFFSGGGSYGSYGIDMRKVAIVVLTFDQNVSSK